MEKIASFKIDHTKLLRGVYVSRTDEVGGKTITTYDIRVCQPNKDVPMKTSAAHTIEHIAATLLRNDEEISDRVIYFGPMGCMTGFYLILTGMPDVRMVWRILMGVFYKISTWKTSIPGSTQKECGNYKLHDIEAAREVAWRFYSDILQHDSSVQHTTYPNSISKLAIICAMDKEANLLRGLDIDDCKAKVFCSGIGKVNAAIATVNAIETFKPDAVMSFGYAGGLRGGTRNSLVIAKKVFYYDVWCGDENAPGQIQGCPQFFECQPENRYVSSAMFKCFAPSPVTRAPIATGDSFVTDDDTVLKICGIDADTVAVDMESAAVAQVCYARKIPFMAYRVISDIVGAPDQVDQYEQVVNAE